MQTQLRRLQASVVSNVGGWEVAEGSEGAALLLAPTALLSAEAPQLQSPSLYLFYHVCFRSHHSHFFLQNKKTDKGSKCEHEHH
jgi:predicted DNA repair protein MutK